MIKTIEELSMNAWPALQTNLYDGWVLRFANGYTKRANSVNPLYPSAIDLAQKIAYCEVKFKEKRLPGVFKLTSESNPDGIDAYLASQGYAKVDETGARILNLGKYQWSPVQNIHINDRFDSVWLSGLYQCSRIDSPEVQQTIVKMVTLITGKLICATKVHEGKTVGCGYGVIERGYVGIFDIIVDEKYRGRGYGQDIVCSILNTAVEQGAQIAYLLVVAGNKKAENLYQKLGFEEIYRYWYRVKQL